MFKISVFLLLTAGLAYALAQSPASTAPDWVYRIRMVSISHRTYLDMEKTKSFADELQKLRNSSVNTIMAHGSFQFLPDLPDGKAQWRAQVNYATALPYSQAVKQAGFHLFHHTTSTFAPIEAMDNPEYRPWVSCDIRTGQPSLRTPGTSYGDACFMDMNHPDFQKKIFTRMAEYAQRCGVDAWMCDEVEWLCDQYSGGSPEGSMTLFQRRFGHPYPQGEFNPAQPEWRQFLSFRYDSGGYFYRNLLQALQTVNPRMQLSGCLAGISKDHRRIWAMGSENWLSGWTLGFLEMEEGHHPRGKQAGYLSTTFWPTYYREMALYNAFGEVFGWPCSYALGYPATWKMENSEQFYLWALNLSMGFRYWMRDYQAEPEWFAWEANHEADLLKPRLISEIGIFFPEQSRDYAAEPALPFQNWSGLSEALAWHNIPADQVVQGHFQTPTQLQRFKLLILPSHEYVSPSMLTALTDFVRQGGTLLIVGDFDCREPFTANHQPERLYPLQGLTADQGWQDGKVTFQYQGETYLFPNGMRQVIPLPGTIVLANVDGIGPALLENRLGNGRVLTFTGRWGTSMYAQSVQKGKVFKPGYQPEQRRLLARLTESLLPQQRRSEVRNLPAKVLFNAYDSDGDFDGIYRRTLHILDSFDGYEPGEAFFPENRPCRFQPLDKRNDGKDIVFVVRDFPNLSRVRLLSPDFTEERKREPHFIHSEAENGYVITVPARDFGRYTILVLEP